MNGLLHVSSSPHARSKVTTDKIMFAVLLALAPAACVVAEYGKEVRKIEQRISEFTASHPAGRHERSRSLSAGAER